jgi:hypothetical protein
MMNQQDMLKQMIDKAWEDYVDLHKAEIESGYDDAMDGFERKEAEGFAMGLEAAYHLLYNETYTSELAQEFDPYEFEDSLHA